MRPGGFQPRPVFDQHRAALLRAFLGARPDTRLFRAEFQYLPLRDSPNENPHVELALQPGELLLVHGPMDEDRFYWGETLDGRAGLVPSNFVQRITEPELRDLLQAQTLADASASPGHCPCPAVPSTSAAAFATFEQQQQQQPTAGIRPQSPSFALAVPQHLAQISHDFSEPEAQRTLPESVCPYPPADISNVTVQELRQPDQPRVPWPRELQIERKLSRSLLLSWLPPEGCSFQQPISQYQICMNGQVRAVVPGSFKCRALLEDLELDKFVNVSVRAVSVDGLTSPDAACTLSVGVEAPVAPQHVRVANPTPNTVQLSWYPSNSSAEHIILLNALKVGVCPPGVFQVQLNGLTPSTIYRLSVRTKHPRAVLEKRPVERCVDFKTLPKIGLPDAPKDVQVEPGPQPGTLLLSWRPNTSQPKPPSRACVHCYLVYADGRCIAQVPGATADHVLLRLSDFADDPPVFLAVRTRTKEGTISADSNVVRVPRTTASAEGALRGNGSLLSASLPAHLLGQLIASNANGPSPSAMAPPKTNPPSQQGLLLMPAVSNQQVPQPPQNGPHWEVSGRQQQIAGESAQQQQQQQQYFTFHPKALDKELPRLEERPDVLAMEQNYVLRHQQRQRLRSATPDRRSFPLALANRQRPIATVMAGSSAIARNSAAPNGSMPLPPQLARLRNDSAFLTTGSTRSEPDLRPSRTPGMDESRWFVAIQDHQPGPSTHEELPFRRHQLVKVYGDVDGNGCFWAEVRGRFGLVPAGKLVEIAKDDLFLAAEQRRPTAAMANGGGGIGTQPWMAPAGTSSSLRRMRWGSIKSRSYEHAESSSGQQRRQRAAPFMGGSDQEGPASSNWHGGEPWAAERQTRGGWQSSGRVERRQSAIEVASQSGGGGNAGGTGYRLPALNGSRNWRPPPDEDQQQALLYGAPMLEQQRRQAAEEIGEDGLLGEEELLDMGTAEGELPMPAGAGSLRGPSQLMVAKYDYDSRQLSPNVDAEQVELSFSQGDMITVYGPMDEDGFYLGELNGVRGLVPSNFLQPAQTLPDGMPASARPKGVAFSADLALANHTPAVPWPQPKTATTRRIQPQQQPDGAGGRGPAAAARLTGATGMTSKAYKVPGIAPAAPGKPLAKKSSDLSAKALQQQQQPATRKGSQAAGTKGQPGALKRKG